MCIHYSYLKGKKSPTHNQENRASDDAGTKMLDSKSWLDGFTLLTTRGCCFADNDSLPISLATYSSIFIRSAPIRQFSVAIASSTLCYGNRWQLYIVIIEVITLQRDPKAQTAKGRSILFFQSYNNLGRYFLQALDK